MRFSEQELRAAHERYGAGESMNQIALDHWQAKDYRSVRSCATALSEGFRGLRLATRPKREAVAMAATTHGLTVGYRQNAYGHWKAAERRAQRPLIPIWTPTLRTTSLRKISDDQVREAYVLLLAGWSLHDVARAFWVEAGYSRPKYCAQGLASGLDALGLVEPYLPRRVPSLCPQTFPG